MKKIFLLFFFVGFAWLCGAAGGGGAARYEGRPQWPALPSHGAKASAAAGD